MGAPRATQTRCERPATDHLRPALRLRRRPPRLSGGAGTDRTRARVGRRARHQRRPARARVRRRRAGRRRGAPVSVARRPPRRARALPPGQPRPPPRRTGARRTPARGAGRERGVPPPADVPPATRLLRDLCPSVDVVTAYPPCELDGMLLTHGHYIAPHLRAPPTAGSWTAWPGSSPAPSRHWTRLTVEDYEALDRAAVRAHVRDRQPPSGRRAQRRFERWLNGAAAIAHAPRQASQRLAALVHVPGHDAADRLLPRTTRPPPACWRRCRPSARTSTSGAHDRLRPHARRRSTASAPRTAAIASSTPGLGVGPPRCATPRLRAAAPAGHGPARHRRRARAARAARRLRRARPRRMLRTRGPVVHGRVT